MPVRRPALRHVHAAIGTCEALGQVTCYTLLLTTSLTRRPGRMPTSGSVDLTCSCDGRSETAVAAVMPLLRELRPKLRALERCTALGSSSVGTSWRCTIRRQRLCLFELGVGLYPSDIPPQRRSRRMKMPKRMTNIDSYVSFNTALSINAFVSGLELRIANWRTLRTLLDIIELSALVEQ